jgi:hypothetical protein
MRTVATLLIITVVGCTQSSGDDPNPNGTTDEATAEAGDPSEGSGGDDEPPTDDSAPTGPGDDGEPTSTGNADDASSSADSSSSGSDQDDGSGGPEAATIPTDGAALLTWLEAGSYLEFAAEPDVHASAGPHGGGVRTFVNPQLFDSLATGNRTHPVGAGAVKELYSGRTRNGWAVSVKVASGSESDTWYWYEIIGNSIVADGIGEALCAGCHADGADHVLTPYPLQ